MAIHIWYVGEGGSDVPSDGTAGTTYAARWATLQYALGDDGIVGAGGSGKGSEGDIIRICSNLTLASAVNGGSYGNGTTTASPLVVGWDNTTGLPIERTIDGAGLYAVADSSAFNYWSFAYLHFTNNSTGRVFRASLYSDISYCRFSQHAGTPTSVQGSTGSTFRYCTFESSLAAITEQLTLGTTGAAFRCNFSANPVNSQVLLCAATGCDVRGCTIDLNGHSVSGAKCSAGASLDGNIVHGSNSSPSGTAFFSNSGQILKYLGHNIVTGVATVFPDGDPAKAADYNYYWNCIDTPSPAKTFLQRPSGNGYIALTADPFVDAPNGDFRLNNVIGGGAELRKYSFPM